MSDIVPLDLIYLNWLNIIQEFMNKKAGIILGVVIVLSAVGFFINGGNVKPDTPETTAEIPENTIIIKDFAFTPEKITVKKGTTVTFINEDIAQHNAVDDDANPKGPDGPLLSQGESYEYVADEIGVYDYHCAPHPFMKGTIEVVE